MSTSAFRVVAVILSGGLAWSGASSADALGCGAVSPLTPETVVKKNITGPATLEFAVGEIYLMPESWAAHAWREVPLRLLPKDTVKKGENALNGKVSVIVSGKVTNRLRQLGIAEPTAHFRGKFLRVTGTITRTEHRAGPEYRLEVTSLDQLQFIRKT